MSSPALIICRFLDDGCSDWCEVVPYCNFDLHFSNSDFEHLHVHIGHLMFSLEKFLFKFPACFWIAFVFELYELFVYSGN